MSKVRCLIRHVEVEALPEEKVRQALLKRMVDSLGYPPSLLVVEQEISQFPHLSQKKELPQRRIDIACYAKGIHPQHALYPLLIIECKAVKLTSQTMRQVIGYNHYIEAPFIVVANEKEISTGYRNPIGGDYRFFPTLPFYSQLLDIFIDCL